MRRRSFARSNIRSGSRTARALLAGEESPFVGANLFARAIAGGAQALGVPAGLAVGYAAAIISFELDHPSLPGTDDATFLHRWFFQAPSGAIRRVWRVGWHVVPKGLPVTARADRATPTT